MRSTRIPSAATPATRTMKPCASATADHTMLPAISGPRTDAYLDLAVRVAVAGSLRSASTGMVKPSAAA
jgi:hypothetical protein